MPTPSDLALSSFVALALAGCANVVTSADVPDDGMDARADAPDTEGFDAPDADPCANPPVTPDCPMSVAEAICAMWQPCRVCPQTVLPDGGVSVWMAVHEPLGCPCPNP